MEKYIYLIIGFAILAFFSACSDEKQSRESEMDEAIALEEFQLAIEGLEAGAGTRAVGDYVVNTTDDPTAALTGREDWLLDVVIYNGTMPYVDGEATFEMGANINTWIPQTPIYFPNYLTQRISLRLYPVGWTEIATDQSAIDGSAILGQDILEQNGNGTVTIPPAHIPEATLRHANSMLDFRITGVVESQISSVVVLVDGEEYQPYQALSGDELEYLVIIPVGSSDPTVIVYTVGGARYQQTTINQINSSVANTCYCFTLEGLELSLGEITIAEWTTGPGILGEYTTEETYPTFRGPANTIARLFYDNGLSQEVIFNDRGESTIRPAGRTLTRVLADRSDITLDPPLILRNMVIDLTSYFEDFYFL